MRSGISCRRFMPYRSLVLECKKRKPFQKKETLDLQYPTSPLLLKVCKKTKLNSTNDLKAWASAITSLIDNVNWNRITVAALSLTLLASAPSVQCPHTESKSVWNTGRSSGIQSNLMSNGSSNPLSSCGPVAKKEATGEPAAVETLSIPLAPLPVAFRTAMLVTLMPRVSLVCSSAFSGTAKASSFFSPLAM